MQVGSQFRSPAPVDSCDLFNKDCPGRVVLDHLTSRWGLLLLVALRAGPMRYNELRTLVEGISEKMLSQTLRTLVRDGLLIRDVQPTAPPSVSYTLTPLGNDAAESLEQLLKWVRENGPTVLDAQSEYDQRKA